MIHVTYPPGLALGLKRSKQGPVVVVPHLQRSNRKPQDQGFYERAVKKKSYATWPVIGSFFDS
jgi:hypothetical protein